MVLELGDSLVLSAADSLLGDFSVFASDLFELLLVDSALLFSALLFFSLEVLLFDDGLVALSAAGLLVAELFLEGEFAGDEEGEAFAAGVMVAPTEAVAAGVIVALVAGVTVAAGVAAAFVEAGVLVVVVPVVVVPLVEVTPTLKLGVTP